jgi:hypothetical protein
MNLLELAQLLGHDIRSAALREMLEKYRALLVPADQGACVVGISSK